MVDFRGISPARQPQAIHTVHGTPSKTHCSFSVFISAPSAHEFHSLARSEQHTVGNDTYSIIHSALNFISFSFSLSLSFHPYPTTQTYKVQKYKRVLFLLKLSSQTYNNSNTQLNTQTCSEIKYWKVSQTPGQMLIGFPKEPAWINYFLRERKKEKKWRQQVWAERWGLYDVCSQHRWSWRWDEARRG